MIYPVLSPIPIPGLKRVQVISRNLAHYFMPSSQVVNTWCFVVSGSLKLQYIVLSSPKLRISFFIMVSCMSLLLLNEGFKSCFAPITASLPVIFLLLLRGGVLPGESHPLYLHWLDSQITEIIISLNERHGLISPCGQAKSTRLMGCKVSEKFGYW